MSNIRSTEQKCIVLFKSKRRWDKHVVIKLSAVFSSVETIYALTVIRLKGYRGLLDDLNSLIASQGVKYVFFAVDFFPGIDYDFISRVSSDARKILITLDDVVLHDFNSITGAACDFVLTSDPVSVLKYQEEMTPAIYFPLESSREIYPDKQIPKTSDVLFFGVSSKADRQYYLEYLMEMGINVKIIGDDSTFLSIENLVHEINSAKIVLNFSKTDRLDSSVTSVYHAHQYLLQFKGRIIESGLCKTVCVSEYCPAIPLLFKDGEVPMFSSREECYDLVHDLLRDDGRRKSLAQKLHETVISKYEDAPQIAGLSLAMDHVRDGKKKGRPRLPFWYEKQVLRGRIREVIGQVPEVLAELRYTLLVSRSMNRVIAGWLVMVTFLWILYFVFKEKIFRLK